MIISKVFFSPKKALLRTIFLIFLLGALFWIFWKNLSHQTKTEYIFLIDNSLSMSVQDIELSRDTTHISRLDASKNFIKNFLENFPSKTGVITFSQNIFINTPITADSSQILATMSEIIPVTFGGGSDVFKAISSVSEMYRNHKNLHIIVLTDAEFFDKNTENFSIKNSQKISIIGVGTERGGLMLTGYDTEWRPIYRQFEGKNAISALSPKSLSEIASHFLAEYFWIQNTTEIRDISKKIFQEKPQNHSYIFINIFLVFLLFFVIIFRTYSFQIAKNEK